MNKKKLLLLGGIKGTWSVIFNGVDTGISQDNSASITNLHDAAMTIEGFIYFKTYKNNALVVSKSFGESSGWALYGTANGIGALVWAATDVAIITVEATLNAWHHIAMTWDDAGDRKARIYIDGIVAGASGAASGAVVAETNALRIGGVLADYTTDSYMGWIRISNNVRYAANFTAPLRSAYPANDVNTVRLFKLNEGTGTVITDYSANAQNATLANGTWIKS